MSVASLLGAPRDHWHALRDRWLASARFQRWAARFPPTRPIARREARALFDLVAGFVYSQVLLACVQLRVLEALADGPLALTDIAGRIGLPIPAASRLLRAAAAVRLVEQRGAQRFGLGRLGAAYLGNPAIRAMVEHHRMVYTDLADPVALLRGHAAPTALSAFWAYARESAPNALDEPAVAAYSELMAASQSLVTAEILAAYPIARHRTLLDVGGGDGSFLVAAAAHAARLRVVLFDLPAVAARAHRRFAQAGLTDRARVVSGDFRIDPLPAGADLISLVRVLHDHDEPTVLALLRAARTALPDDGTLLVAEPLAQTRSATAMGDAYFGFYLLAMRGDDHGAGEARSRESLSVLLNAAGFSRVYARPTAQPVQVSVLVAKP